MLYKEALAQATKIKVDIRDFPQSAVTVIHEEGTVLHFNNAVPYQLDAEWVAVLAEHHGTQVYHEDDVLVYAWSRSNIRECPV